MSLVGIPEKEQQAVFQTVAAVLHLGNVAFADGAEQDSSLVAAGLPRKHLEAAAQLLGVPAEGLARALITRTRQTTDGDLPITQSAAFTGLILARAGQLPAPIRKAILGSLSSGRELLGHPAPTGLLNSSQPAEVDRQQ